MEWQKEKLGKICRIELGKTPSRSNKKLWDEAKEGKNVWLSIADLPHLLKPIISDSKEYISEEGRKICKLVPKGTLILSFKLSIGRLAFTGKDLYTNEAIAALYIGDSALLLQDYLYWYLKFFDWDNAVGNDVKVKGKTLNKAKLKEIDVFFPPIEEQKRIVTILDQVFADIERARATAETNLKNARELFDSYLEKVSLNKKSLGKYVTIKTGKLDSNAAVEQGKYPFFTCSREVFEIDSFSFDCEAILLAGNNAVGNFNVKHYSGKFDAYQRTYVITIESDLDYRFLYYQMIKSLKELKNSSVGAGTKFLKIGMIKDLKISVPSIKEQEELVITLDKLNDSTERLARIYKRKLEGLEELKKSILQKAFTGELTKSKGIAV